MQILAEYCKRNQSLRSFGAQYQLNIVISSLPALWQDLDDICRLEDIEYMPIFIVVIKHLANISIVVLWSQGF